jgi:hypothetical protein
MIITIPNIVNDPSVTLEAVRQPYKIILRVKRDNIGSLSGIINDSAFETAPKNSEEYKETIAFLTKNKIDFKVTF